MIKAIFFDIDGTLMDHDAGEVPGSTIESLLALREKGVKLFVATGRPPSMVGFMEEIFPFDGFVTLNGQLVTDREGKVIHRMAHHREDIRRLLSVVAKTPFPCTLIEEDESFMASYDEIIAQHYEWADLPVPKLYDIARLENHDVLQFLAYIPPESCYLLDSLEHIEITSAGSFCFDVIPKEGGKEVGIAATAAYYGVDREEVMTFGDGDNDGRMLRWAGIGVAMGNGTPVAKAAADYVTSPVGKQGIANALKHFDLL